VFSEDEISPKQFSMAIRSKRFWKFFDSPEHWLRILSKRPAPGKGLMCPYLEEVLHLTGLHLYPKEKLITYLVQKGHATYSDGRILGSEIMRLMLTIDATCSNGSPFLDLDLELESMMKLLVSFPNVHLDINIKRYLDLDINNSLQQSVPMLQGMNGLTPLIISIRLGLVGTTLLLAEAGANIQEPAACGFSALQLARYNCNTQHPRPLQLTWPQTSKTVYVSRDSDLKILRLLNMELKRRKESIEDESGLQEVDGLVEDLQQTSLYLTG
jgi:hypothetical protein